MKIIENPIEIQKTLIKTLEFINSNEDINFFILKCNFNVDYNILNDLVYNLKNQLLLEKDFKYINDIDRAYDLINLLDLYQRIACDNNCFNTLSKHVNKIYNIDKDYNIFNELLKIAYDNLTKYNYYDKQIKDDALSSRIKLSDKYSF